MLSSSARLDKRKKKNHKRQRQEEEDNLYGFARRSNCKKPDEFSLRQVASRDRTGKRDNSEQKREHIHKEQMAAFRKSMAIRVADKHDPHLPDAISKFDEIVAPSWWKHYKTIGQSGENG
ncbi:MAG: hypothetical protein SGARI_007678, partial [Bacillariaceae sp.]